MKKLSRIVNHSDTKLGIFFDLFFLTLILLSVILFSLETVNSLKHYQDLFLIAETIIVILYTIEYILRIITAHQKLSFVFSFYGIIDLLTILPFYISLGVLDLKVLRAIRLIRIVRISKLIRYSRAIDRLITAFNEVKSELIMYTAFTLILMYISAAGIYMFEHEAQPEIFSNIFTSLWWSVATLTTVGYGDIYPITVGGKVYTFVILMLGLGLVSVPSALLASALIQKNHT